MSESRKKLLLGGYFSALKDVDGKKRYQDKLKLLEGLDPYETTRSEWLDDVDLWPNIGVRIRESMTVTQKSAYWVMPTGVKAVQYARVREMDFIGKKRSATMMKSCVFRQHSTSPSPASSTASSTTVQLVMLTGVIFNVFLEMS